MSGNILEKLFKITNFLQVKVNYLSQAFLNTKKIHLSELNDSYLLAKMHYMVKIRLYYFTCVNRLRVCIQSTLRISLKAL